MNPVRHWRAPITCATTGIFVIVLESEARSTTVSTTRQPFPLKGLYSHFNNFGGDAFIVP